MNDKKQFHVDWARSLPFIGMHFGVISLCFVDFSWTAVLFGIGFYCIRMLAITGFYHRYFAHRAFKTSRWFQFVGACVDTGNSFALLEDPIATVEAFAPWAKSVHLKDQALQLTEDGFWLGDIPLGQGGLDLKRMVDILRETHPQLHFTLELITRDPLLVPCLREDYWATFPDLPARDLARTLRYVREHTSETLQQISELTEEQRLAREDANVRASLDYARDALGV